MDLHHSSYNYAPFSGDPEARLAGDPEARLHAGRLAESTLQELYQIYSAFAPYLSDEDIRDIAVEAHRCVMAQLMGDLAELRDRWERNGAWWDIEEEETEEEA